MFTFAIVQCSEWILEVFYARFLCLKLSQTQFFSSRTLGTREAPSHVFYAGDARKIKAFVSLFVQRYVLFDVLHPVKEHLGLVFDASMPCVRTQRSQNVLLCAVAMPNHAPVQKTMYRSARY